MSMITANNLSKTYTVVEKEPGIRGSLKSLIKPKKNLIKALDNVSFEVNKGEILGYIGPNGSGKSTTIKLLLGILHPSSGEVLIQDISPQKNRIEVVKNVGVVFGQRSNLVWDIRLNESFELYKRIYKIDNKVYKKNKDELIEILGINDFINKPVRQLSLGQRMRGEIAISLIHEPSILFLDEPTIGLDFDSRNKILKYISQINKEKQVTVILTSHNIADIEKTCNRIMILKDGKIIEDDSINNIVNKISHYKQFMIEFEEDIDVCINIPHLKVYKKEENRIWYRYDKNEVDIKSVMKEIIDKHSIIDIKMEEPELEDALYKIYEIN